MMRRSFHLPFRGRIKTAGKYPESFDGDEDYVRPIQPAELLAASGLAHPGDITFRVMEYDCDHGCCTVEIEAKKSFLDALSAWIGKKTPETIRTTAGMPTPVTGKSTS